jgi:hypothetical protein
MLLIRVITSLHATKKAALFGRVQPDAGISLPSVGSRLTCAGKPAACPRVRGNVEPRVRRVADADTLEPSATAAAMKTPLVM